MSVKCVNIIRSVSGLFFTFNKTTPRLTVLTKRLHCCQPRRRTSSGRSTGHQAALMWILLTTRSGAFCKSECVVAAGSMTSNIWWTTNSFMNGAASVSVTEQSAICDSVTVSARKADTFNIRIKHCHWKTENKLLLSSRTGVRLCDFVYSLISG